MFERAGNVMGSALWRDADHRYALKWRDLKVALQEDSGAGFWLHWYEAALVGKSLDIDMLTEIARLPDEDWRQGPDHINPMIAGIWERFKSRPKADPIQDELDTARASSAPVERQYIDRVRQRVGENRETLPPTIDALQELLILEIERWQTSNELNVKVPDECVRQVQLLVTMYEALSGLRACVPEAGLPSEEITKEAIGLGQLYLSKFAALPRDKADDVVDGVWGTVANVGKATLVLGTTSVFVQFGFPALAGVAVGTTIFAPKSAADVIKAAKEYLSKSDGK
jgi:hypothetical protein